MPPSFVLFALMLGGAGCLIAAHELDGHAMRGDDVFVRQLALYVVGTLALIADLVWLAGFVLLDN